MNKDNLRIGRNDLIKQAKAVIEKAESERRGMTDGEIKQYDDLMKKIDSLGATIEGRAELDQLENELSKPDVPAMKPWPADSRRVFGSYDPREVRMYTSDQKMLERERYWLPDGIEAKELGLGRWLRGIVTGEWAGAEAEWRAMSTLDSTLGGYLLPAPLGLQVIDLARATSILNLAGAVVVPMDTKTLTLARITDDPTAYWKAENEEASETEVKLGNIVFTANALVALCRLSVELIEDAQNIDDVVNTALAKSLALELDRAGMFGAGANNEPLGIYFDTGLNEVSMGDNGAALSNSIATPKFLEAIQAVREANGIPRVAVYNPRTEAALNGLQEGPDTHQPLIFPKSITDLRHHVSTQIPNNLTQGSADDSSVAFVGDFSQIMVGMRTQIKIEIAREEGDSFKNLQILIRAYLRGDVQLAHANHISKLVGIIPE